MRSLTTFLFGGLGNQLFQYAAGRALALRAGVPLVADVSGFGFDTHYCRELELENFCIPPDMTKATSLWKFKASRLVRRLSGSAPLIARCVRPSLIVETSSEFDSTVLRAPVAGNVSMMGYWQDERYFLDQRPTIEREFHPTQPLSRKNAEISARMSACSVPVAVHIRHRHGMAADAQDSPSALAERIRIGITLPQHYYQQGIAVIAAKVQSPTYFVFADDPQWVHSSLKLGDGAILMEKGRGPDHEDLVLMSRCTHHLIANSSFSWWGAWLGAHPDKIVIAPKGFQYTPNIPQAWTSI